MITILLFSGQTIPLHQRTRQVPSRSWPWIFLPSQLMCTGTVTISNRYSMSYVTSRYDNGKELDNPPLQDWEDLGEVALKASKSQFLIDPLPPTTPAYLNFDIWTNEIRNILLEGHSTHANHIVALRQVEQATGNLPAFDLETLGGRVSFKAFWDIFKLAVK
jgi:hypothetical protein